MSLTHAILGLLNLKPMTGYDLKHSAFDQTVAHFWQADQAQIYRTLDRMASQGWVTSELEIQTDRPNRKVYSLTDAGREELDRWLREPQSLSANREAFLVQMFFADKLSNEEILAQIDAQIVAHQARIKEYDAIPLPPLGTPGISRRQTLWRMTLELGMAQEQTSLDWLRQCRQIIAEMPDRSSET